MDSMLVELERVSRIYDGGRIPALQDVSLQLRAGEWVTITGASGSGKTTLLNVLSGLDQPTSGRVLFEKHAPRTQAAWAALRSRRIGFVFQAFHLLPTLTAIENVEIPMFGVFPGSRQRRSRAMDLLARVGLESRARHLPADLSGGERQRVAIARSLANSPALLLADEPTGNLDSKSAVQIVGLLEEIYGRETMAVVYVTHNPRTVQNSSRWLHMVDGRIEARTHMEVLAECSS